MRAGVLSRHGLTNPRRCPWLNDSLATGHSPGAWIGPARSAL